MRESSIELARWESERRLPLGTELMAARENYLVREQADGEERLRLGILRGEEKVRVLISGGGRLAQARKAISDFFSPSRKRRGAAFGRSHKGEEERI